MTTSRPVSRTFRALMIATALGLALPSCALFKAERVALRSTALETLPRPAPMRSAPHVLLFPSVFLSGAVLGFIMLGDAVRDAFDPKSR